MNTSHTLEAVTTFEPRAKPDYWLTIFIPVGIAWECADGSIRTRNTLTGKIKMPARKCGGTAESWLAPARLLLRKASENVGPLTHARPAVTLSADEEAEYERLRQQKDIAERKVFELKKAARAAVQMRNLMEKELKRIRGLWLPLAERKFPS